MINSKTRKKLIDILKGTDYRKVVSERADCHPNTVGNILREAPVLSTPKTERVEIEILVFAKEVLEEREIHEAKNASKKKKALAIAREL